MTHLTLETAEERRGTQRRAIAVGLRLSSRNLVGAYHDLRDGQSGHAKRLVSRKLDVDAKDDLASSVVEQTALERLAGTRKREDFINRRP
jgi:hypothetical protein